MKHAISILTIQRNNARNNAPIHKEAGDHEQAALDLEVAADCQEVLDLLAKRQAALEAPVPLPTLGRIVLYTLSPEDVTRIDVARFTASQRGDGIVSGNSVSAGQTFPMQVVRVWSGDLINGRVMLDGPDDLWVTSCHYGNPEETPPALGTWHWPPRV